MSSETTGAAQAAPTLTELAEGIRADLAGISDADRAGLAKAITAGEKLNQAKAQLEHGRWLPRAEKHFDVTPRMAQQYMLLSANTKRVSHLGSIREALTALPKKQANPRSTRPHGRRQANPWQDDDVLAWVARRLKAGKTRDDIADESAAGLHGWPLPGEKLSQNGA